MVNIKEFGKLNLRVGEIVSAEVFPEARTPAYKLSIDFGPLGLKTSSARIVENYNLQDLPGTKVVAILNLKPKRIGSFISEVLVLGVKDSKGAVILLKPDNDIESGARVD